MNLNLVLVIKHMQNPPKFMTQQVAEALLQKYDSPLFVYDANLIKEKSQMLLDAAQDFHVSYAMKANSNKEILKLIKSSGIKSVDVVSPGEIYKALQNSYSPNEILYTENFSSEKEIEFALKCGVILNIGAFQTLEYYKDKLSGKSIFIRINPEIGAGENYNVITGGPKSKFGIYCTELDKVKNLADQNNIKIIGLHQHIGSNLKKKDKDIFIKTTQYIFKLVEKFPDVTKVNIGGGVGVKYKPEEQLLDIKELYDDVRKLRDRYSNKVDRNLEVWIEPGRFLVADSGYLLCKITAKKKTPQKTFYGTDTGFNHLLRPALYGSHHNIINLNERDHPVQKVTVCGNICQSTDNLGHNIELNGEIGDILCIQNAGAYAFSMSSNYNQRPKPAEVMIQNGNDILIRRRQTYEDLVQRL